MVKRNLSRAEATEREGEASSAEGYFGKAKATERDPPHSEVEVGADSGRVGRSYVLRKLRNGTILAKKRRWSQEILQGNSM
jgi:hypothetical protein